METPVASAAPVPAKELATISLASPTAAAKPPKTRYHRKWESTFGRRAARCHPCSVVASVRKEGKPILLLIIIGILASVLDYTIECAVAGLGVAKTKLLALDALRSSPYALFGAWSAFTTAVATLACVWTTTIDPFAVGSGIPEMKTILSCDLRDEADRYLGARTLLSKAGGLTLALGSGISVGREGPFVHTASIIAHRIMKHVAFFHRVYTNDILRRHVYNAACAIGVASTFRAPIGGVLFSIEVTSTVFMVSNYWRAFVAALSGSIARQVVGLVSEPALATYHPMFPTSFSLQSFTYVEYAAFALLGVVMGVAGALYVVLSSAFKRWWKCQSAAHPMLAGMALLVPVCLLLYLPGSFGRSTSWDVLTDLFSPEALTHSRWTIGTALPSVYMTLPLAGFCRLGATILSTSLLLPAGDFIPTFTAGALFGRLAGEVLALVCPDAGVVPGGYALVGGAALVASATQTVSVAVIAIEFTGQFVYLNPLLLAVLLASSVGGALSVSVYDSVIVSKGLAYLPMLRVNLLNGVKARDVMDVDIPLLTSSTSMAELSAVLVLEPAHSIPVISDVHSRVFYGCAARRDVDALYKQVVLKQQQQQSGASSATKESEARPCAEPTTAAPTGLEAGADAIQQTQHSTSDTGSSRASANAEVADSSASDAVDRVELLDDRAGGASLAIDSSVLQVDTETALTKVHLLFEMIKCSRIWVTRRGALVGRIDRARLPLKVAAIEELTRSASVV